MLCKWDLACLSLLEDCCCLPVEVASPSSTEAAASPVAAEAAEAATSKECLAGELGIRTRHVGIGREGGADC